MLQQLLQTIMLLQVSVSGIIKGVILGIVQGISEWLPVSSKTQVLVAATYLLHLPFNQAYVFGLFMEIGTIIAAVIYFRKEVYSLARFIVGRGTPSNGKLFWYVLVTVIATAVIAVPIYTVVGSLNGSYNIGIPMIILGMILIGDAALIVYSKSQHARMKDRKTLERMSVKDYLLVGIAQGIAALPGISRSGITTSALLLLNVEADEAFRLSFITGIFAAAGAFGLTLLEDKGTLATVTASIGISGIIVAIVVAAVISMFMIKFLIDTAKKSSIVYLTAALGGIAIVAGMIAAFSGIPGVGG